MLYLKRFFCSFYVNRERERKQRERKGEEEREKRLLSDRKSMFVLVNVSL